MSGTDAPLWGRVVVVTGGNGGIGLGLAEAASAAGAKVMIWARNQEKSDAAVEVLRSIGPGAAAVRCDVSDPVDLEDAMSTTLEHFGQVDGMVANAAAPGQPAPVIDMELEEWRSVLDTNLTGVFLTFQLAARQMIKQGTPGALVALSSIVTRFGSPARSHYAVAKYGVDALVKTLAIELAEHQIRCNALSPGWTKTELVDVGFDDGGAADRFERTILKRTPANRWGTPEDYKGAVVHLLDPALSFHTGDTITIDGGYTIF